MIERYTLPEMRDLWRPEAKFDYWLTVELAILWARVKLGRLSQEVFQLIRRHASFTVTRIEELEKRFDHDMIAFVETVREVLVQAGAPREVAEELHKNHTSYDIEDPATMLQLGKAGELILERLKALSGALLRKAHAIKTIWKIAPTHGQYAEPSTLGHLLLVFKAEIDRAVDHLNYVLETNIRFGKMSGANGTYAGLDPEEERLACECLGLQPALVATQILQRDRHARFMSALTTAAGSIEQMAATLWLMMRSSEREVQEPRKREQRGSSAMPFKINPILTERLMGMPRLMRGYEVAAQENIAVLEWRDISQSSVERVIFPDATSLLHYMADKATKLIDGLVLFPANMARNLERTLGVWAGQRVRYALVKQGVPDNDAYLLIQRVSFRAVNEDSHLVAVLRQEPISEHDKRTAREVLGGDLDRLFSIDDYIQAGIDVIYSRFPLAE